MTHPYFIVNAMVVCGLVTKSGNDIHLIITNIATTALGRLKAWEHVSEIATEYHSAPSNVSYGESIVSNLTHCCLVDHICVFKLGRAWFKLVKAYHLFRARPLSDSMLAFSLVGHKKQTSRKLQSKYKYLH